MGIELQIPESVAERIKDLAAQDGVSVDAFVASVLTQRAAVAHAQSYVSQRASKGSASALVEILDTAPDVEPEPHDSRG